MNTKPQNKILFFLILIFLFREFTFAETYNKTQLDNNLNFINLNNKYDLSQYHINCIFQDSKGFLWVGTTSGLCRYDGSKFNIYKNNPENSNSLSDNSIQTIHEDFQGNLWIGTKNGGINKYNPVKEKFIRFQFFQNDPDCINDNNISVIFEDHAHNLWVGTSKGLDRYLPGKNRFEHFIHSVEDTNSISYGSITSIIEDSFNNLWIGTHGGGLNQLVWKTDNSKDLKFIHYQTKPNNTSICNNYISDLFLDKEENLWIGTSRGLNKFNPVTKRFKWFFNDSKNDQTLDNNSINCITQDFNGNLWIGTSKGLNRINPDDQSDFKNVNRFFQEKIAYSFPGNQEILSLNVDNSGVLWIGTRFSGLKKLIPFRKFKHTLINNEKTFKFMANIVWALHEDRDGIFRVGTHRGIFIFDKTKKTFKEFSLFSTSTKRSPMIFDIFEDHLGDIWFGTYNNGLFRLNKKNNRIIRYHFDPKNKNSISHNTINSIAEDNEGNLWFSTKGGLNKYIRNQEKFIKFKHNPSNPKSLCSNLLTDILIDKSNNIWIGSEGSGLDKISIAQTIKKDPEFEHYHNTDSTNCLKGNYVSTIYEDRDGDIWVGTNEGGLNKYNPNKNNFSYYIEKHGLPDNVINSIIEDLQGNIWLSTETGLTKFNKELENFKNYDKTDGLYKNGYNSKTCFRDSQGKLYFGSNCGFTSFFPSEIQDNPIAPKIELIDFQIFNESIVPGKKYNNRIILDKSISYTKSINLEYRENLISFEFSILHFVSSDKNKYAYMLDGLEKRWNYSSKGRKITYTQIPPGDFTLLIKAANNDGTWNKNYLSLDIHVSPPFWLTKWFITSVIILILAGIYLIFQVRLKRINEKKNILEKQVVEKNKAAESLQEALHQVEDLKNRLEAENIYLQNEIKLNHNFSNIITQSPVLKIILEQIEQVAETTSTVLITGESGTGKELLARAIHDISSRKKRTLVKVDCASLPPTLIESELFGHEKGAFTGALTRKIGRFELADKGTIFLDEIGELPLKLQQKLLRVLQDGEFERLGDTKTQKIDVRILAATNRNLKEEMENGKFREDLFYRLNVFPIHTPPLRERKEDIPLLVTYFVEKYTAKLGKKINNIPQSVIDELEKYNWPGNIRELENIIQRAIIVSPETKLQLGKWFPKNDNKTLLNNTESLEEIQKKHIISILEQTNWKVSGENGAAKLLHINSKTLYSKMKKLNIYKP